MLAQKVSGTNGLSRTEEALLRSARQLDSILRIVGRTIGNNDDTIGDIPLYEKVREFLIAKIPTLKLSDETHVVERGSLEDFSLLTVRPTSFALELLASKADYLAVDGTDRWVGGYGFRDIRLAGALIRLSDA